VYGINDPGHTCDEYLVLLVKSGMTALLVHVISLVLLLFAGPLTNKPLLHNPPQRPSM
jgi:hypothetical protein